ncbi:MAG: spoIIIJ-associated protein [Fimbriimonadaceae bacterium]|jgi:spoIIIJ-associated protein|nr:spoIIIJ-associated protein [Fimbriimonadaceae bacterium]
MQSIELTAKSVDEARKTAAEKLGVSPDAVQITVLEETKGLFGKTNVRVRAEASKAEAPAAQPAPKPAESERTPEPVKAAAAEKPEKAEKPARAPARGRGSRSAGKAAVEAPEGVTATAPETIQNMEESLNAPPPHEMAPEGEAETQVLASDADAKQLLALVNEILDSGELDVSATAKPSGGRYVNVELDGKDVAFLVGKHGEVLNALQYLINIGAARRFSNGVRITLDGNNYRERREVALSALATKIATEVKARREEAVLDALPAFERRVVHKALAAIEGVETYSEGEEPNRRVVIAPAEA